MCLKRGGPQLSSQEVNYAWSKPITVFHFLCQWHNTSQSDLTGGSGEHLGKVFFYPERKEEIEEGEGKDRRKERKRGREGERKRGKKERKGGGKEEGKG